jgi:4-hydroxyphenylpyruvate dioxygenase
LRTGDIFATAAEMRRRGVELLPIPENYYSDLEARNWLEPQTLELMRSYQILYDRDEAGEYFHFFTRAFAKRFFFEIVERRGYNGYGAANAAVRLAAQARYKGAPASLVD